MSGPEDDVLSAWDDIESRRQAYFEGGVVRMILRRAGISMTARRSRFRAERFAGQSDLSFQWMRDEFPSFPVLLGSSKLRRTAAIPMAALFGASFAKLPFFAEYQQFLAAHGADVRQDWAGLVWNLPRVGLMVLHNSPSCVAWQSWDATADGATRILRKMGRPPVLLVIESLTSFLDSVGTSWAERATE